MNINTNNVYPNTQNFTGNLVLNKAEKWNEDIAQSILTHPKLKQLAAESDTDLVVFQSIKSAKYSDIDCSSGDEIYRLFIAKQQKNKSIFSYIKRFLGMDKIGLSRRYHTVPRTKFDVLPSLSYKKLRKALFK